MKIIHDNMKTQYRGSTFTPLGEKEIVPLLPSCQLHLYKVSSLLKIPTCRICHTRSIVPIKSYLVKLVFSKNLTSSCWSLT